MPTVINHISCHYKVIIVNLFNRFISSRIFYIYSQNGNNCSHDCCSSPFSPHLNNPDGGQFVYNNSSVTSTLSADRYSGTSTRLLYKTKLSISILTIFRRKRHLSSFKKTGGVDRHLFCRHDAYNKYDNLLVIILHGK